MKTQKVISFVLTISVIITFIGCDNKTETSSNQLYMDIHKNVEGLTAEAVTGAHKKDLEVQEKYGVNYVDYWFEEESGTVFCLVEAPSKEAAAAVHKEAHGLVADEIVAVAQGI